MLDADRNFDLHATRIELQAVQYRQVSCDGGVLHGSNCNLRVVADLVINQPRGKVIHVIADNLSAHKSQQVKDFLAAHPKGPIALHAELLILAEPG